MVVVRSGLLDSRPAPATRAFAASSAWLTATVAATRAVALSLFVSVLCEHEFLSFNAVTRYIVTHH
jgi:hypothetical protein